MNVELSTDFDGLAACADRAVEAHESDAAVVLAIIDSDPANLLVQRLADGFRGAIPDSGGDWRLLLVADSGEGPAKASAVAEVPDPTLQIWAGVLARSSAPRVRGRLGDLLFHARFGDRGLLALDAIDAYLEWAADLVSPGLRSVRALGRALHLAKVTRNDDRLQAVRDAIVGNATGHLDLGDPKPGTAFGLIRLIVDDHAESAVDQLLDRCRSDFVSVWDVETTIGLQRQRATDDSLRQALDRELVQLWLDEADRTDALQAVLHREKASQLARTRGLPDLAEAAVRALQAGETPQLASFSVSPPSSVTESQVDELIESLIGDSWPETVGRLISYGPPSGNIDRNRATATDFAATSPLRGLFPAVRLGGDGLPRYTPSTEEERADDQLVEVETMMIRTNGHIVANALMRAGSRFQPGVDEVTQLFGGTLGGAALARSVVRFNDGDFEAAAYIALPLVERRCRELLLAVNSPIYRVQREKSPATYPGLGALLAALADHALDPSWHRFLRAFFSAPNGFNLRNEALHGFTDELGPLPAALTLIAVMYLSLLTNDGSVEDRGNLD